MSITQAMFAGSSALKNMGDAMTVIGNNLANANTTAFKASTASFEDVLIQSVGGGGPGASAQVGTGVGLSDVQQNMEQGSFTATSNVTDLSIDGQGFFIVKDINANKQGRVDDSGQPLDTYYTRAGSFKKDLMGDLVNPGGLVLQGRKYDLNGELIAGDVNINLEDYEQDPPRATSKVTVKVNLDATTPPIDSGLKYDPNDPTSYDFSTSARLFDTQGKSHNVELQFRKLPTSISATVIGQNGATNAANNNISFDLSEAGNVTFTFTPVAGGTPIVSEAVPATAGSNTLDLTTMASAGGATIDQALTKDARYVMTASADAGTVTRLVGDDGEMAVVGEADDSVWEWHAVVQTSELATAQQGSGQLTAVDMIAGAVKAAADGADYTPGKLVFDQYGRMKQEGSTPIAFNFTAKDGGKQEVIFDFGSASNTYGDATNDYVIDPNNFNDAGVFTPIYETGVRVVDSNRTSNGTMQVAGNSTTFTLLQDGYPLGVLDKLSINSDGEISGNFTNGNSRSLYRIRLANFKDVTGLEQSGANLFRQTRISGDPILEFPNVGQFGEIQAFALEQSNVDMSAEFVRMITTQRGFQANSRIVTVADGMMEELLALKR